MSRIIRPLYKPKSYFSFNHLFRKNRFGKKTGHFTFGTFMYFLLGIFVLIFFYAFSYILHSFGLAFLITMYWYLFLTSKPMYIDLNEDISEYSIFRIFKEKIKHYWKPILGLTLLFISMFLIGLLQDNWKNRLRPIVVEKLITEQIEIWKTESVFKRTVSYYGATQDLESEEILVDLIFKFRYKSISGSYNTHIRYVYIVNKGDQRNYRVYDTEGNLADLAVMNVAYGISGVFFLGTFCVVFFTPVKKEYGYTLKEQMDKKAYEDMYS